MGSTPDALPALGASGLPPWRSVLLVASGLAVVGAFLVVLFVRQGPHLPASAPFEWRFAGHVLGQRPLRDGAGCGLDRGTAPGCGLA